ncbi:MAG: hypothetical protein AAGE80_18840 [Pseudomonadota bacterium]
MLTHLRRFAGDTRGSITVEFMIWIPVIMLWLSFSVAFYDANKNRNDAAKAAYTISDLVSRQVEVSEAFFDQLAALQDNLLPRTAANHRLRITSIQFLEAEDEDAEDAWVVQWSAGRRGAEALTEDTLNTNLLPPMADLDTVVLVEIAVPFVPVMQNVGINTQTWSLPVVSRPRFVSSIVKTD